MAPAHADLTCLLVVSFSFRAPSSLLGVSVLTAPTTNTVTAIRAAM